MRDIKVLWTLGLFAGGFSIDIKVFRTLGLFAGGFSIDIKVFQTLAFQRQDPAISVSLQVRRTCMSIDTFLREELQGPLGP